MASVPLPSPSVLPPVSSASAPPPPSSTSPPAGSPPPPSSTSPPAGSPPPSSLPNATSDPPTSSNATPPAPSPPLNSTAPPPSPPPSVPPSPPPPSTSPPPPAAAPPQTVSTSPPPIVSSPPPSASPPPPTLSPPPPPTALPPPPSASPPPTAISPPPPASSPPPTPNSAPPSSGSPPVFAPPPSHLSPPPPSAKPPSSNSPSSPVQQSPPPPVPSAPAPKSRPPSTPSTPSPPPGGGATPSTPAPPSFAPPPGMPTPVTPESRATPIPNRPSDLNPDSSSGGSSSGGGGGGIKASTAVPIAVVSVLVILGFVGVAMWFMRRRKKQVGGYNAGFVLPSISSSQTSDSSYPRSPTAPLVYHHSTGSQGAFVNSPSEAGLGNSKSWFTYKELYQMTDGFSTQNILGEGGFGCVYKGCLPDGREVAVKQLKIGGGQGEREFKAEVEIISRVHHRHLVSLVGYCIAENQRLLVYDYVPNNTLHYHLHEGRPVMDWATRVKVAAGAARGIAYLHEDCHPRIIHRDIKSSNILLDNNFDAQVSDFGLARLAMDACTHVTTRVMGTFGYLAPEYASTGKLTEKSDVYSFGVVLLELITGRKPVDSSQPLGDESLVEWARPLLSHALETGEFEELPDPRLESNYNQNEMFRMIEAAAACIRHSAAMRPRMSKVVRVLDSLADIDLNNGIKPGQSELFNAPQSAEIRLFRRMAFGSQDYSTDFSQTSVGQASWKSRSEL